MHVIHQCTQVQMQILHIRIYVYMCMCVCIYLPALPGVFFNEFLSAGLCKAAYNGDNNATRTSSSDCNNVKQIIAFFSNLCHEPSQVCINTCICKRTQLTWIMDITNLRCILQLRQFQKRHFAENCSRVLICIIQG